MYSETDTSLPFGKSTEVVHGRMPTLYYKERWSMYSTRDVEVTTTPTLLKTRLIGRIQRVMQDIPLDILQRAKTTQEMNYLLSYFSIYD